MKKSIFLICLTALVLTSCENFLKGSNVRNELEEVIEIANTSPVTFNIIPDENTGTAIPSQLRLKKKEKFEISFIPSGSYSFVKWEVLDKTTMEPVEGVLEFEDEYSPETKGVVLAPREGLIIYPKCIMQPAVADISPSLEDNNYANISIKIKFTIPMQDQSVFNYDNIILSAFGSRIPKGKCFEEPVLSADKKTLVLKPKPLEIQTLLSENNSTAMALSVILTDKITTIQNGEIVPLKQNELSSFTVNYIADTEDVAPTGDFYITGEEISIEKIASGYQPKKFTEKNITSQAAFDNVTQFSQAVLQNLVRDTVYIYGSYYDEGSGVSRIHIDEIKTNNTKTGAEEMHAPVPFNYDLNNAQLVTENGQTRFCIKHILTQENGPLALDVTVYDACDNPSATKRIYAVKKNSFSDDGFFDVYNYDNQLANASFKSHIIDNMEEFSRAIKTIVVQDLSDSIIAVYNNVRMPQDTYSLICEYKTLEGQTGSKNFTPDNAQNKWTCTLDDIASVAGLSFKVIARDSLGNEMQKEYTIPKGNDYLITMAPGSDDTRKNYEVVYKDSFKDYYHLLVRTHLNVEGDYDNYIDNYGSLDISKNKLFNNSTNDNYKNPELISEDTYHIIPVVPLNSDSPRYGYLLLGEIANTSFSTSDYQADLSSLSKVELDETGLSISSAAEPSIVNLSLPLKTGTWESFDKVFVKSSKADMIFTFDEQNGIINCKTDVCNLKTASDNSTPIKITGVKGSNRVDSVEYDLARFSKEELSEYDDTPPEFNIDFGGGTNAYYSRFDAFVQEDYVVIFWGDKVSEPKLGTITILDNNSKPVKTFASESKTIDGKVYYYFSIPVWDLMPASGLYNKISYYLEDNNGNKAEGTAYGIDFVNRCRMSFIERDNSGDVTVSFTKNETVSLSLKEKFFSKYNENNWDTPVTVSINYGMEPPPFDYEDLSGYSLVHFRASKIDNSLNNSFVKILEKTFGKYTYWNSVIYYNGSYSGNGQFNLLLDNPNSDANVFVKSDAKVFLHTMVTQVPYEVCKNWTVEEWEYNKEHYNDICLDFTGATMNSTMGNYDIPVSDIPDGSCYCVIAHFANNTVRKSQVIQK